LIKIRKKITFWIIGTLLALFLALFLLFPVLVNLDPIKKRVVARISEEVEGKVTFQRLDLSLFPRPHALIAQGVVFVPERANGTFETLKLYPKILPLLIGRLGLAEILVEQPDFKVIFPTRLETEGETHTSPLSEKIEKSLMPLLAPLAVKAPHLTIRIENGRVGFSGERESSLSFHHLRTRIVFPPEELTCHLTCSSDLGEEIEFEGRLNTEDQKGQGRIHIKDFCPHRLINRFLPDAFLCLAESQTDLKLNLDFVGTQTLTGNTEWALPHLVLQHEKEQVVLRGQKLKASFVIHEGKTELSLAELSLDYPFIHMSGELLLDQGSFPEVNLELQGRELDVHSVREVVLSLAGNIRNVNKTFQTLRAGHVPWMTLSAQGNRLSDLKKLDSYLIKGAMHHGNIFVPHTEMDLTEVKGETIISKGILQGKDLEAKLGHSFCREGNLTLGLRKRDKAFHLDAMIQADLAQLPPILKRAVRNEDFVREVSFFEGVKGNAAGRLVLGEEKRSIRASVDVSEFNIDAEYRRVPYPLKIHQGRLCYSAKEIDLSGLKGELGVSSFSNLRVRIGWSREPHLIVESGEIRLFLDEIHPWLSSFEALPFFHSLKDTGINGTLLFSNLNLRGPLRNPKDWVVLASGRVRDCVLDSSQFPGPVKVSEGDFNILEDTTRQELHFQETQISMLNTFLTVSGYLDDYRKGLELADINLKGDVSPEGTKWVSNLLHVPSEFRIRSPLSVSEGRFMWERDVKTCFKGNFLLQSGPQISLDIIKEPELFVLKNLHVRDEDSRASVEFAINKDAFSVNFTGNVSEASIHRLFVRRLPYLSELQGDFKASILFHQPKRSTVQGKLTGKNLIFPWGLKVPLRIGSFGIYGQEDQIKVDSAICTWGECSGVLDGTLNFAETEYAFDMGISSDALILDKLKILFKMGPTDKETNRLWNAPVRGNIKLNLGAFTYDENFTWTPFQADISFHPEKVVVSVTDAKLCGISTPGTLEWTTQGVSLDFHPMAEKQELDPIVNCLREGKVRATGLFDLKGHIKARGKAEHLSESVQGYLEAFAKDGRINQSIPLEKVFAYLSVIEIFRGQLPKMTEEGLAYKSITLQGDFQEGKFVLNEGVLDGLSMDMAAEGYYDLTEKKIKGTLLVAPLKTADSVIDKLPGINHIMAGTLVSIPVKIEGELSDPAVKILPASAVGEGLWGMMKRTVQLPFIIIDSIFSNNGKHKKEDQE
jgi:hypothetical protein